MGCFPCTGESSIKRQETKRTDFNNHGGNHYRRDDRREPRKGGVNDDNKDTSPSASRTDDVKRASVDGYSGSKCRAFKFSELECATDNFKPENFLGEGGFGKVYKGCLVDTGQIVAIKQLDHNGGQGSKEFCVEVKSLNRADHPNLVKLIGCCAEGVQRVLVYEYMPLGSLEDHLHGRRSNRKRLDWNTRMNIAAGAARGLEYLHTRMEPPIIYRDLKCSNILLGEGYHPKLSDFGLAKDGPCGDDTHVSTRVMGTYGYCAPDYAMTGQLTFKSDIYSFGVVLLEIITGRKAIDNSRSSAERNLVDWAKPLFKNHVNFPHMADPALEGQFPRKGLIQALSIAAICIVDDAIFRPPVADVVSAMNYIASQTYDPNAHHARTTKKCSSSHTP